jgi:glycosyltransferase involved in cell wall biosynthesis
MLPWCLLLLFVLAAGAWLLLLLLPSQRSTSRFLYNAIATPDQLNRLIPRDDVTSPCAADPTVWPSVTILVPGRNEGHLLPTTLRSLCLQDYPDFRIVFIDDQSTDNTPAVCAALAAMFPHLTILRNQTPPPPGWIGKAWALHQAAAQTAPQSDYLLFCDADLRFHPQCLRQMMRLARHRNTDLASLLPALECRSPGELLALLAAMTLICIVYPLAKTNHPRHPKALVAGGFLLFKRAAYQALGGHQAVRGQVIEDIALGTLARSRSMRVFTVHTHELMHARMYEGFRDAFQGLRKNAYAGIHYQPLAALAVALLLLFGAVLIPLYPILGTFLWITQPSLLTAALCVSGLLAALAMLDVGIRTARLVALRPISAALLPASFGVFLAIFLASILDHYRGGNTWSGRRIPRKDTQTLADLRPPRPARHQEAK